MVRVAGQREAGGLGITDVFLVVPVGQAVVAPGLVGKSSSIADGVLPAATVICWSPALDAAAYRWPRLARVNKSRQAVAASSSLPSSASGHHIPSDSTSHSSASSNAPTGPHRPPPAPVPAGRGRGRAVGCASARGNRRNGTRATGPVR